ncbi:hypothetical protein P3T24_007872, partial [Paraburkholderia sp. GAS33]|uniref:hypothetical protein n=1 Tax=Paraburkholderia sp. GAS33 TaxID=3035130 RepID=UPI003D1F395E
GTEVPFPPGVPANRCIINLTVSACPDLQGQLQEGGSDSFFSDVVGDSSSALLACWHTLREALQVKSQQSIAVATARLRNR